ncbi:MAG: HtaA domain-containing protein [Solirubrobacterales bacterium]
MSRIQTFKNRTGAAATALAAAALAVAVLASPAAAASASGQAFLRPASHDKGRTLSGQGVKLVAGAGAGTAANGMLTLPLSTLEASGSGTSASLGFERGKRSVALTEISFDFAKRTLNGSLDGRHLAVFKLGASVDAGATSASLQGGKLRLTGAAAGALKQALGLERALVRRAVGMVWLAAQAEQPQVSAPAPEPVKPVEPIRPIDPVKPDPRPVVSGGIGWGFLSSWRSYVLLSPPAGSEEVSAGATATGELTNPATTFGFPATGGSYTAAYGTVPAELTLASKGSVDWAKPGHMINEVRLSNLEVEFGPAGSWLIADVSTDFGAPEATEDVKFASLDPAAVTPAVAADSVTWTDVPATLTADGAASFAGFYAAGKELESIDVTAGF